MKIKICGLSRSQDIEIVNEFLPDYIGFVFAESSRQVSVQKALELKRNLDKRISAAGVFVNADTDDIIFLCKDRIIDVIQLHGDENAFYVGNLKNKVDNPIIKAVRVQSRDQIINAQSLPCDYLLLDTFQYECYGGSGEQFDHTLIPELRKPFFLAGGLNAGNIAESAVCRPYCLDVSSGAENRGKKSREKIKEIVKIVRSIS